jgi:hypothetical protein
MTSSELAMGAVTFLAVIAAGFLSEHYLDRHLAAAEAGKGPAANQRLQAPMPEPEPSRASGACVDTDGSWKNWSWANVPMLSPKCAPDH